MYIIAMMPRYDCPSIPVPQATYQNYTWFFPKTPVIAASPWYVSRLTSYPSGSTNTGATNSYIGLAINGVAIYNDANMNGADAYIAEKATFDSCYGHVSPNPAGLYHYTMYVCAVRSLRRQWRRSR